MFLIVEGWDAEWNAAASEPESENASKIKHSQATENVTNFFATHFDFSLFTNARQCTLLD